MYEIIYDYIDDGGTESRNIMETFDGTWTDLKTYILELRRTGCYNISANAIDGT